MSSSQTQPAARQRLHYSPWRRHNPWPVAAGVVALVVATPILVVAAHILSPGITLGNPTPRWQVHRF